MMRHHAVQIADRLIGRVLVQPRPRGLTLVECTLALVILSLAVTVIAYGVTAGQMQAAEAFRQSKASMLAEALMDEIFSKSYSDPVTGAQPDRTAFGQAGQYNVFNETAGNLKNAAGVRYPGEFQRFSRSAAVATGTVNLTGLGTSTPGLTITVIVKDADGKAVITLNRFMVKPS